jgi:hypothetical protein
LRLKVLQISITSPYEGCSNKDACPPAAYEKCLGNHRNFQLAIWKSDCLSLALEGIGK